MKRILKTLKWLFKAWPLLLVVIIGIVHYTIYCRFQYNGQFINKVIGAILQLIGGLVVLYSINENMGIIKRGNLLLMIAQWFKTFPFIKRPVTISLSCLGGAVVLGTATITAKHRCNTVEEKLEELERQVDECRQMIYDNEKVVLGRIGAVQSNLENAISHNNREIQDVKKLLDESVVGSIKAQIFGVLLVIYGAVLSLL